jgi:hypothetical protein
MNKLRQQRILNTFGGLKISTLKTPIMNSHFGNRKSQSVLRLHGQSVRVKLVQIKKFFIALGIFESINIDNELAFFIWSS